MGVMSRRMVRDMIEERSLLIQDSLDEISNNILLQQRDEDLISTMSVLEFDELVYKQLV